MFSYLAVCLDGLREVTKPPGRIIGVLAGSVIEQSDITQIQFRSITV
jgi:hypothetical protein